MPSMMVICESVVIYYIELGVRLISVKLIKIEIQEFVLGVILNDKIWNSKWVKRC